LFVLVQVIVNTPGICTSFTHKNNPYWNKYWYRYSRSGLFL